MVLAVQPAAASDVGPYHTAALKLVLLSLFLWAFIGLATANSTKPGPRPEEAISPLNVHFRGPRGDPKPPPFSYCVIP